jgi:hypothetical protein
MEIVSIAEQIASASSREIAQAFDPAQTQGLVGS